MYSVFVLSHIEVFVLFFPGLAYNCVGQGEPYCIHLFYRVQSIGFFLNLFDMFIVFYEISFIKSCISLFLLI